MIHLPEGTFPDDSLVLKAVDFLKDQQKQSSPFLMFFSGYYVHTPVIPNNSWLIEKYRNKMPDGSEDEIKYAAFVETMDHYYGQILKALEKLGFENNTIVIFTSDNGGHPKFTDNAPLRGNKWNLYEGGIRAPFFIKWPEKLSPQECSVPIIQWDILPTLCDLFGLEKPAGLDGESLMPLLEGRSLKMKREDFYWHFPYYHPPKFYEGTKPCSALRSGNYKMIYFYEDERTALYNLENDLGETTDLSSEMPELMKKMRTRLLNRLTEANARFPEPNFSYSIQKE